MNYEMALELEQQEREEALIEQENTYFDGKADGAFGYPPQYANNTYLDGYCAGVKELPRAADNNRIDYWKQIEDAPVQARKAPLMVRGFSID